MIDFVFGLALVTGVTLAAGLLTVGAIVGLRALARAGLARASEAWARRTTWR